MLEHAADSAFVVAFANRLALVVSLFTSCNGDYNLCKPFLVDEDAGRGA